jgi:hypothetical protein
MVRSAPFTMPSRLKSAAAPWPSPHCDRAIPRSAPLMTPTEFSPCLGGPGAENHAFPTRGPRRDHVGLRLNRPSLPPSGRVRGPARKAERA